MEDDRYSSSSGTEASGDGELAATAMQQDQPSTSGTARTDSRKQESCEAGNSSNYTSNGIERHGNGDQGGLARREDKTGHGAAQRNQSWDHSQSRWRSRSRSRSRSGSRSSPPLVPPATKDKGQQQQKMAKKKPNGGRKIYERVVTKRLQDYMDDNELYPHSMFGFRAKLSTQDVLLQIKEEILSEIPGYGENIIMALDIKGAFDNVSHEAVLTGLDNVNCGRKTHGYVKAFLSGRTATIGLGELRSDKFSTPNKGTQQGSVISPILFNVAMIGLAKQLEEIGGIRHAMYADDIIIWAQRAPLGYQELKLQEAAACVDAYVRARGLACSTEKSELLSVRRRRKATDEAEPLKIYLKGHQITEVTQCRILGMWVQTNQRCTYALALTKTAVNQVARMINRVSKGRYGMKEADTLKLIKSLVVSRVVYSLPYYNCVKSEIQQIDTILKRALKTALQIPQTASTEKLLALGLHNSFEELQEAQRIAQFQRLQQTETGRRLLGRYGGESTLREVQDNMTIPDEYRSTISLAPIPRNMDPNLHKARREARAEYVQRTLAIRNETVYVDAATYAGKGEGNKHKVATVTGPDVREITTTYRDGKAFAASVVDTLGKVINCAPIRSTNPEVADQVAIALATQECRRERVYSDSKVAVSAFQKGRVARQAIRILKGAKHGDTSIYSILWFPAHVGAMMGFL
ncbi:uncharacterized protein [Dermacentor albipictus]|uniref:uncharacterized protein n=1 Tax=Dermacentor albipictus TaxID=60249 RepID=UPI0038FCE2F3